MSVALYIRLSLADEDTGLSKAESESIVSQRMCLHSYLDNNKALSKLSRSEFVDDGFTATNGNRPNFIKMMDKVQAGEIKHIIVRDFSRFFRDYIEAGNYLECVFPFLGVRFISINDNYDSDDYKGSTGGLEMVMRNIIYASYSKDLSVKTRTAKELMMKQGKYVGSTPPYGYIMHPTKRNKLAVDEVVSPIVKRIFAEAVNGKSARDIAKDLNTDDIPTPAKRFRENYPNNNKFKHTSSLAMWDYRIIYNLIQNLVYTGTLVSHRRKKENISSRKTVAQEPIIVEGTHEAIISKEDFEKAQKIFDKKQDKRIVASYEYPLKSLVKCGNCRRAMTRTKRKNISNVFICPFHRVDGNETCKANHTKETELETIAYNAITHFACSLQDKMAVKAETKTKVLDVVAELSLLDGQIESLKNYKIRLYENYTTGEITKDLFLKQKAEADVKLSDIEVLKSEIEENLNTKDNIQQTGDRQLDNLLSVFSNSDKLTYEMAHSFIKAIYIYDETNIEIEWKFKDIF